MLILEDPDNLREHCKSWRRNEESIALAPTMGYYHSGHAALIKAARKLGKKLVVSLFVNPSQFGPDEDLASYPRDLQKDAQIAEECGADILFAPEPQAMYQPDHSTWVESPELAPRLCGRSRPSHFRGVCTIVLKLFMLVQPDYAVFGQKDWQQQAILRRMVRDLNLDIKIETIPIMREADGLAMSSRNIYLTAAERQAAPHIHLGLQRARKMVQSGETDARILRQAVLAYWSEKIPAARLDYLELVHPQTLEKTEKIIGPALMACAIRLGKARLIDNILVSE